MFCVPLYSFVYIKLMLPLLVVYIERTFHGQRKKY